MIIDSSLLQVTVRLAEIPQDLTKIYAVRIRVFQEEQGIDPALEFDGLDQQATHLLALSDTLAIGTLRIRETEPGVAKLERMAVLAEYRQLGVGKKIMQTALEFLLIKNFQAVHLNAQLAVKDFYQKLGFSPEGEIFEEAGIPHVRMRKRLNHDG
jgi:predicted GNAT family N-acyltransferase